MPYLYMLIYQKGCWHGSAHIFAEAAFRRLLYNIFHENLNNQRGASWYVMYM